MNILITGTTGFLGKELVNQLSSNIIFKLNRNIGDYHYDLGNVAPIFQNSFDVVIHNAGKAHSVPKTNVEKEDFFKVNLGGTKNLLKGLETSIPNQFVFVSSVSVYGLDQGERITENNDLLARDPYGLSKIQAEKLVQEWCKQHKVVCTILRLPLVVGSNPPGNLGAMIKGINKGYYFNIKGGRAKKSMVLAEDVGKFILKAAAVGGIYNLTDGYHPTFPELSNHISSQLAKGKPMNMPLWLAKIIAKLGDLLGSKAPINTNKLNKITSDFTFDDSKARVAFGWNPTPVLEGFKIDPHAK
jgi:nucleoside-diphosphate-sugar epimerase